jgi:homogentisate 1,2-dioxygenase
MVPHGPDAETVRKALQADTRQTQRITDTMAFMLETRLPLLTTTQALQAPWRQADYPLCWSGLERRMPG